MKDITFLIWWHSWAGNGGDMWRMWWNKAIMACHGHQSESNFDEKEKHKFK